MGEASVSEFFKLGIRISNFFFFFLGGWGEMVGWG